MTDIAQTRDTARFGRNAGLLGALGSTIGWGSTGVVAKSIDLGGLVVVAYRFWTSTILFFAFLAITGRPMNVRKLRAAMPGGIGLAVDVGFFFSAVKLTTIANASVILALQPVLMIYLGSRLLGERISRLQIVWSSVAIVGVALLLFGSVGLPQANWKGDALAFGAVFGWTAYLYFSKSTQDRLTPVEYTAGTGFFAAVICTPLAYVFGQALVIPAPVDIAYLAVMVFVTGTLAHLLMNWSLTKIPVWVGSTMSLLIPGAAAGLAWLFLDEQVAPIQFIGIALTLVALGAIALGSRDSI